MVIQLVETAGWLDLDDRWTVARDDAAVEEVGVARALVCVKMYRYSS